MSDCIFCKIAGGEIPSITLFEDDKVKVIFDAGPRMYPFYTTIKADYLISSHTNINNFIFIINTNSQNESKCDFLCCSTFEKGKRDYETNQRARTLLKKERIHIPSNTSVIFFDKIN